MRENHFSRQVFHLAVPAALQSMLQASFSVVDQIMIGQLGSTEVAGVGLAGKFASLFSVVAAAVGAAAGIMIAQYLGRHDKGEARRSFRINLLLSVILSLFFTALCVTLPRPIMGLYSQDRDTVAVAGDYLALYAATFLPAAGTVMFSTLLRCMERPILPLLSSLLGAVCNTALNYLLIFGHLGAPALGVTGAAIASVLSQALSFLLIFLLFLRHKKELAEDCHDNMALPPFCWGQYGTILLPILACEFLWSLGENVYAGIYGQLGTQACAAMTLLNPVQNLMIGALSGLSQAAAVMVGKKLGRGDDPGARAAAKKLLGYGLIGSLILSAMVVFSRPYYLSLYQVEEAVKQLTAQIMLAYAFIAPVKVLNMILGGGILRSGGKTGYLLAIDLIGTWLFGVPLGLLAAFVLHLSIPYVYFLLSLEECVRLGISLAVFQRQGWMGHLAVPENQV